MAPRTKATVKRAQAAAKEQAARQAKQQEVEQSAADVQSEEPARDNTPPKLVISVGNKKSNNINQDNELGSSPSTSAGDPIDGVKAVIAKGKQRGRTVTKRTTAKETIREVAEKPAPRASKRTTSKVVSSPSNKEKASPAKMTRGRPRKNQQPAEDEQEQVTEVVEELTEPQVQPKRGRVKGSPKRKAKSELEPEKPAPKARAAKPAKSAERSPSKAASKSKASPIKKGKVSPVKKGKATVKKGSTSPVTKGKASPVKMTRGRVGKNQPEEKEKEPAVQSSRSRARAKPKPVDEPEIQNDQLLSESSAPATDKPTRSSRVSKKSEASPPKNENPPPKTTRGKPREKAEAKEPVKRGRAKSTKKPEQKKETTPELDAPLPSDNADEAIEMEKEGSPEPEPAIPPKKARARATNKRKLTSDPVDSVIENPIPQVSEQGKEHNQPESDMVVVPPKRARGKAANKRKHEPDPEPDVTMAEAATSQAIDNDKETIAEPESDMPLTENEVVKVTETQVTEKELPPEPESTTIPEIIPPSQLITENSKKLKALLLDVPTRPAVSGRVMTCGEPMAGELGMGPDVICKRRPAFIESLDEPICQLVSGTMHNLALTTDGRVYSWGCNDEGALGRNVLEDDDETIPKLVELPVTVPETGGVVKISAGDSHSAAITADGRIFIWGNFRSDQSGPQGLTVDQPMKSITPIEMKIGNSDSNSKVADIASGSDHLLVLDRLGHVYSFGVAEQGQLGRLEEKETDPKEPSNRAKYLNPGRVLIGGHDDLECDRIWAGQFSSFARAAVTGQIFAWGLNRESQLALSYDEMIKWTPVIVPQLSAIKISEICPAQEHTLVLNTEGQVLSVGSVRYGRLGYILTEEEKDSLSNDVNPTLKLVTGIPGKVDSLCAKSSMSFVVTETGELYAWGMASTHLGFSSNSDEEPKDELVPRKVGGKWFEKLAPNQKIVQVSAGGQHSALLVQVTGVPVTNGNGIAPAINGAHNGDPV